MSENYIIGHFETASGTVDKVATLWDTTDILGTLKVRWAIGRMHYTVRPGIYAVGSPSPDSDVFVSANYKLSFDHLRRSLEDVNAWILVLDTKGINVWCAAGKGTFGTDELTTRIRIHKLDQIVNHRKVIVPQLGATGVSAHRVKALTGFRVVYGPVRAVDIKSFINNNYRATSEMRKVSFTLSDRARLIPVELTYGRYFLIVIPVLFFILAGLNRNGFSVDHSWYDGGRALINLTIAYVSGCVITPLLLPWIPFKRFSLKGLLIGGLMAMIAFRLDLLGSNWAEIFSWFLIIGCLTSFLAMNFTGSSTFTSLSGVQKEMRLSLPVQIIGSSLGLIGWIVSRFL